MSPLKTTASLCWLLGLLTWGAGLDRATAEVPAELLDILAVTSGFYTDQSQVEDDTQLLKKKKIIHDELVMIISPLDIPGLNQYTPVQFKEDVNGITIRNSVVLYSLGSQGRYSFKLYFLTGENIDESGDVDVSSITEEFIASADPICQADIVFSKNVATYLVSCLTDVDGETTDYTLTLTCVGGTSTFAAPNTPETYNSVPYNFDKTKRYALPKSWLEGNEDYVSPCDA